MSIELQYAIVIALVFCMVFLLPWGDDPDGRPPL
jgi:hypothetical protein